MVAKRSQSLTSEDTGGSSDFNALAKMHAAMDERSRQNQSLVDKVLNIQQHQQEVNLS